MRAVSLLALVLSACTSDSRPVSAPPNVPVALGSGNGGVNVAAASAGATAIASTTYSSGYAASGAINGDRSGANWGSGGGWNDATSNTFPDWLEVDFAASQTIDEVDVFSVQDNFMAPGTPTATQTFTQYGLTDFRIEAWDGSAWVAIPNGSVAGNNLVWRQVTFAAVTTTKIRVWVTSALGTWSRIAEVEAYTASTALPAAFGKSTPITGSSVAPGSVTLTWPASTGATSYEYCVDTSNNSTCDATWVSTTSLSATLTTLSAGTTYYWQVRARNTTGTTDANAGTWWTFSLTSVGARVNVASAATGATAIASTTYSSGYAPSGAINGDRSGANWGSGGGWNDATGNTFPDWLEVDFATSQTIDEVDVFSVQDNFTAPGTPTATQTFTQYGLTDFRIEAWDGSAWIAIPNGNVSGNNLVWRQLTFAAVTTTKIRVWVTGALGTWSRIAEVEAYTAATVRPAAFSKTSPTTGSSLAPGNVTLTWPASTGATSYEYCVDTSNNSTCDAAWVSTAALSATLTTLSAGTTYFWQARARNATGTTDANAGVWWTFSLTSAGGSGVNVAAASAGATAIASTTYSSGYAPSGAINGDRTGANWGSGGGWNDATSNAFPDWLEVDFAGSQTINEVDVFSVQDNYTAPGTPTSTQTFTQYGLTDFRIEAWDGAAWVAVPNGSVAGNNLVWRQVTFAAVTTTKIRVWVTAALGNWSRIAEVEAYTAGAPSLNLQVEKAYLTQATQRPDGTVSMVANRDALLRVFVTANIANTVRPDVRVRVYDGVTLLQTVTIPAPEASVRTTSSEGVLASTWNVIVPAANIRPALRVLADVDPTVTIAEADRTDNVWPRGGSPAAIPVTTVPTFNVRFVPVTIQGVTGAVSDANKEQFLTTTRRMMPVNTIAADVRAPFTSSASALQSDDANGAWETVLSEVNALRATDGAPSTLHYYGVVPASYTSGVAGVGYLPGRAAIGWAYLPSGGDVSAHEWGHNFSRPHTPCGTSGDANYPYAGGVIGVWGWNFATNILVSPTTADLMGYCSPTWISDWTWSKVMTYRQAQGVVASIVSADSTQEGLLVWGRIIDGRVQLAPAFRVRAPITPTALAGSHRVQLLDANSTTLLDVSINADRVDHEFTHDERQFAVVLPWSAALEQSLAKVRVSDARLPFLAMERASSSFEARSPAAVSGGFAPLLPEPQSIVGLSDASHVRVRWNVRDYPMAMVRDAATGVLLGFVRDGDATVTTNGRAVEVVYSDGVRSVVRR